MSALSPPFPLLFPSRLAPLLRLPSFVRLPGTPSASHTPGALLRAAALELSVLVAHLALYPTGLAAERPADEADTAGPSAPASPRLPLAPLPPVVLLHGFADNRSVFVLLRRALLRDADGTARRRTVVSLNYSPLTCDIRAAAELLGRHVEEVRRRTGADRVDVVGHSLGGLIARYHVQRLGGDAAVRTLVTLGTPHSGTRVARPADVHPIVRQMRPGSPVIEELGRPAPGCRTRFVAVRSDLDQIMVPTSTARLDHPDLRVENVLVTGIGHLALPVHPTVTSLVREALAAPAGQGADTRAYEAPGAPESAGGTVA
ncbi:esterase/lipase family protein [Streptomyces albidoflavus]|uniref:esterase/lipase family protein n=1 Tax=Streptomyces albidoflavus TaxID=1886 RepID=UPI0004C96614|nr:alpha/beta hydrolase [Streptomyces albidoflavus]